MHNLSLSLILAVITILVNWPIVEAFWRSPHITSFDGMSHLAVGEYYATHIFPNTWGWARHWFAGMPFPNFYPPLFYLFTALLYTIFPFSYTFVAKSFLSVLIVALPGLSAAITWFHTRSFVSAFATGCLTIMALSHGENSFGISIHATLTRGLFTQLLGYICLLIWCHFFLMVENSRRYRYLSILFLCLTLISNVHVLPVAGLFFLVVIGRQIIQSFQHRSLIKIVKTLGLYALLGIVPLCVAAFWYVPLIAHWQYAATMALPSMPMTYLAKVGVVYCALVCAAFLWSIVRKEQVIQVIALVCILSAVASAADTPGIFPSLPIQPFRMFASFSFLSCIPIGYLIGRLTAWICIRPLQCLALLILISPFVWNLYKEKSASSAGLDVSRANASGAWHRLAAELPRDQGLTNVEVRSFLEDPAYLTINALLAAEGVDATYVALRESSISSVFMTPLRNSLSAMKEAWGIDTFLAFDQDFLSQALDTHLDRAAYMGVSHLLAASPITVEAFGRNARVRLEKTVREWRLYGLTPPAPRAAVLANEPAVFFGPVSFKKRSTWAYDYTRFQEELFFRGKFDMLIASAHNMLLDSSEDLDRFRIAILTEYRYRDLERAYSRLKKYSEDNILICIASDDPLFHRLSALADSPNIDIFERLQGNGEDIRPLRHQLHAIFSRLDSRNRGIEEATKLSVREVQIGDEQIHVFLTRQTDEKVPILIKVSYFPWWRRVDADEPVYMVTPTFMLTYARSDLTLEFMADSSVWLGLSISLLAVLSLGGMLAGAMVRNVSHRR